MVAVLVVQKPVQVTMPAIFQSKDLLWSYGSRYGAAGSSRRYRRAATTVASATSRRNRGQTQWVGKNRGERDQRLQAFRNITPTLFRNRMVEIYLNLLSVSPRVQELPKAVVNRGVLAIMFGGLAEKFVTVDAGCWRGWTAWDVVVNLPSDNWATYQRCVEEHPLGMAMAITGLTYFLADWIAQICEGTGPMEFDSKRLLRSTLVGTWVFGPLVHTYYLSQAHLFDCLFPSAPWYSEMLKIAMDQTAFCFTYNITYYLAIGALNGRPVSETLAEFQAVWWKLQTAGWKFWPFVGLITHTVVPLKHKVLFVDMAEVCWVTYLSLTANVKMDDEKSKGVLTDAPHVAREEAGVRV